jgi:alkanesulfonate monooxygenase SsuD/methylene tetrahydromethanopterin reductase-like flavin-dependent oxidoreductase (luciferase family)
VKYSINIPNFGDFADVHKVIALARAAEQAGWDGLFIWDHVVHDKARRRGVPFADPWIALTAVALSTQRLRFGSLLTPVARRRPEQLARQVATLDGLSGGRVIFAAGLGAPIPDEFGSFGDRADAKELAGRLDEGLELINRYWSGRRIDHEGRHYQVHGVELLPTPVQQPRPPVWIGGYWPTKAPMRRAARWDGAVPLFRSARHGVAPDPGEVRDLVAFIADQRQSMTGYEVVVGGATPSDPSRAAEIVGPLIEAGATWWDERMPQTGGDFQRFEAVLRRAEQGPPRF